MKMIMRFLKDYKKECVLAPLFKMLEAIFELFVPLVVSSVIDKGIVNADKGYIMQMCLMLILLAIIGLVCAITAQYFSAKAAVGAATGMRHSLFAHIQTFSFTEMDTLGTSTLVTRMTSDINQVQNGINMVLRLFLRSPFIVFGAMIMAFTIDVKAALVFVAAIPVLALIVFGIMLATRPMYKNVQSGLDKILGITRENLTGVRVIRAFNKEQDEIKRFKNDNESLNRLQKYVGKISGLMNPLTYVVVNVSIIALIWIGGVRVNAGALTQGQVVALYNYMSQILVELIKLANLIITITKALACAGRIESVFDVTSGMADGSVKEAVAKEEQPGVEFKNVSLTYSGSGAPSVEGINFKAMKGQTIGVIGGTGSGKSSLVNLIPRLYDATQGEVLVDGVNVKDYDIEALRNKVGIVMQKAVLFKGTIRENMWMGKKGATDEQIDEALEISQSKEFVDSKQGRLDYVIEQGGKNLSGGQRQRVALARSLVIEPKLLLLDEPLSNLDAKLRLSMRVEIKRLQKKLGITTLFVTHDQEECFSISDKVAVMNGGVIEQYDTPENIYRRPATEFVARFIGFENFLDVEKKADHVYTLVDGIAFKTAMDLEGKEYTATIRPDDIRLADETAFENVLGGKIGVRTFLGKSYQYEVETAAGILKVNMGTDHVFKEGDMLRLYLPEDKLILVRR